MSDTEGVKHKCPHCEGTYKNLRGLQIHLGRDHKDKVGPPKRRSRAKQPAAAIVQAQPDAVVVHQVVNFCPHCGTNIGIVAHALAIAEGVSRGPG